MASKKENIKSLFKNTRSRVIIVFTAILLITAVVIGVVKLRENRADGTSSTRLWNPPGIQSIPGALNPTVQYAKLQEIQNVSQAETALKKGGSAIPTIIRTQALGQGVEPVGVPTGGAGGVGFSTLSREDDAGAQRSIWIQNLQNSNCSKAAVTQVVSQGASPTDLKKGCTCTQLKDNGYQVNDLEQICSCKELRAAGYNARQLKEAGFSAGRLRLCGFDACELRDAGFTAQQMKDGGFSDGELKGAGFSDDDIAKASGLPPGITAEDVRKADCQVDALKQLKEKGVTASAIRRINGCSASQLKAAGFSAADLKNAGFSAAELRKAGFTPAELRQAGYSGRDLLNAGFSPQDLATAGFTPAEIAAAESELPPGISPADVKTAGCDVEALKKERLAGVSAKLIRQYAGCSAKALKEAGFSDNDLANAGFNPAEINAANGLSDAEIRAAGCDANKLKFLYQKGVSAEKIHQLNGCNAAQLKAAGFNAAQLTAAGFTPQQLLAAGFSPEEVRKAAAGSDEAIRSAGCDPLKLKELFQAGVSAKRIRELNGCSAEALKNAGYDAKALSDAGFTPEQLLAAGFVPAELLRSGVGTTAVVAAGRTADCSLESLKAAHAAGVSASTIKQTLGCSAAALKAAGYTAKQLRDAGFTAAELRNAGFNAKDLKDAGFTAKELRDAGFSAADLKNAGFTASQLKEAGFSAKDLKDAGFSAAELKKAGFTAAELKQADFSAADLKNAGFSAEELKKAGFSASQLRAAGFNATQLKELGFSAAELRDAGFSAQDLAHAGFSAEELKAAGYSNEAIQSAGLSIPGSQVVGLANTIQPFAASNIAGIPGRANSINQAQAIQAANAQQLQSILQKQNAQVASQKSQQQIQQRTSQMMGKANQSLQSWQRISIQTYVAGTAPKKAKSALGIAGESKTTIIQSGSAFPEGAAPGSGVAIKTGDVLFAVLDTSVNSDEPGPILATIVTGKLKGAKLIGSFNLPANADKMVISFNTLSVPGISKSVGISAYAIDPNTARTALSSDTNHHYLLRYGSLFASSFLEGIGNAFQSASTTVTIGGTGGGQNVTIQNGIDRSILQNAVIGLAQVGKAWGQVAQQQFSTPTTVQVYSGTGLGILFTQDVSFNLST